MTNILLAVAACLPLYNAGVTLMRDELQSIALQIAVTPESLQVHADRSLIDQVLLNLLRNAVDALADTPTPMLRINASRSRTRIAASRR